MPAIIMHAGAGVLLIIMTNFASPHKQTTKPKSQITNHKTNQTSPLPHMTTSQIHQQHKISSQNKYHHKRPAPYNNFTAEMQYFQMRKMDQT